MHAHAFGKPAHVQVQVDDALGGDGAVISQAGDHPFNEVKGDETIVATSEEAKTSPDASEKTSAAAGVLGCWHISQALASLPSI